MADFTQPRKGPELRIFPKRSSACCNNLRVAGRVVVLVETVVSGFGLLGCLLCVYRGAFLAAASSGLVTGLTLATALLLSQGIRAGESKKVAPYLMWKPLQLVIEAASLGFFAVVARRAWADALDEALKAEALPSDAEVGESLSQWFSVVLGVGVALSSLYLAMGVVFVAVAWRWHRELRVRETSPPLISYSLPNSGELPIGLGGEKSMFLPSSPPPYAEAVYAPTTEKA